MTSYSRETEDAAIIVGEAVKVSTQHNKDGMKVTFVIQPQDMPKALWASYIGSRYHMVLVEIGDDETMKPQEENVEARKMIASANLLCREDDFQRYLLEPDGWASAVGQGNPEEVAATELKRRIGVSSRSELRTNEEAREKFRRIRAGYLSARNAGAI